MCVRCSDQIKNRTTGNISGQFSIKLAYCLPFRHLKHGVIIANNDAIFTVWYDRIGFVKYLSPKCAIVAKLDNVKSSITS